MASKVVDGLDSFPVRTLQRSQPQRTPHCSQQSPTGLGLIYNRLPAQPRPHSQLQQTHHWASAVFTPSTDFSPSLNRVNNLNRLRTRPRLHPRPQQTLCPSSAVFMTSTDFLPGLTTFMASTDSTRPRPHSWPQLTPRLASTSFMASTVPIPLTHLII